MTDERNDPPLESSAEQPPIPMASAAVAVVTSAADMFGEARIAPGRWLKAARSGPLRVLPKDEVAALGARIAGDPKLLERLVGVLRQLSTTLAPDGPSAATLEIAECVLQQRVPEIFGLDVESRVELVLVSLTRLRRELKAGRGRHLWLETILRTTLLNRMIDPMELPGLTRAALGASPSVPKISSRQRKRAVASGIVLDEEVALLLSCLGKPQVLVGSLAVASIYRRRIGGLEDALNRLGTQLSGG
jgi:hypothetical protein